jgi:hypothetical protein
VSGRGAKAESIGRYDEVADAIFRADAELLGYLGDEGPGLWAYYRDYGMVPPEVLEGDIPERELTGFNWWDFEDDGSLADDDCE